MAWQFFLGVSRYVVSLGLTILFFASAAYVHKKLTTPGMNTGSEAGLPEAGAGGGVVSGSRGLASAGAAGLQNPYFGRDDFPPAVDYRDSQAREQAFYGGSPASSAEESSSVINAGGNAENPVPELSANFARDLMDSARAASGSSGEAQGDGASGEQASDTPAATAMASGGGIVNILVWDNGAWDMEVWAP